MKLTNEIRKEVYRRDGYQCALCGYHSNLQIHHVIPRGQGGNNEPQNLITLCDCCHALAHGMNLRDWEDVTQQDVIQCATEYLADYYTDDEQIWRPFDDFLERYIE